VSRMGSEFMKNSDMRNELLNIGNGAHALAIQILGNREDAADAVHDAFISVLARPEAYDPDKGPFRPWFLRVLRNRCIDLLRLRRTGGQADETLIEPGLLPEQRFENLQREEQLRQALSGISSQQRQIVILRDYLDLSYAEIAVVLEIAAGTVMSRLHRARLALKKELERDDKASAD